VCVADTTSTQHLLPIQSAERRKTIGTPDNPNAGSRFKALIPTPLSDDHSRVEPPLPIPNRTVKRSRANDSRHLACESRSSSDSLYRLKAPDLQTDKKTPSQKEGVSYCCGPHYQYIRPCPGIGWLIGCLWIKPHASSAPQFQEEGKPNGFQSQLATSHVQLKLYRHAHVTQTKCGKTLRRNTWGPKKEREASCIAHIKTTTTETHGERCLSVVVWWYG
jgi:hypothetical protein